MSGAGGRASGGNHGRTGRGRARPAAIVEMIAQSVWSTAYVHAGADITIVGDAAWNGCDTVVIGAAGIAVCVIDGRRRAFVARTAVIGTIIARPEGVERVVVDHDVGVFLIDIVGLVDDRRRVPVRPVDPAGA